MNRCSFQFSGLGFFRVGWIAMVKVQTLAAREHGGGGAIESWAGFLAVSWQNAGFVQNAEFVRKRIVKRGPHEKGEKTQASWHAVDSADLESLAG